MNVANWFLTVFHLQGLIQNDSKLAVFLTMRVIIFFGNTTHVISCLGNLLHDMCFLKHFPNRQLAIANRKLFPFQQLYFAINFCSLD